MRFEFEVIEEILALAQQVGLAEPEQRGLLLGFLPPLLEAEVRRLQVPGQQLRADVLACNETLEYPPGRPAIAGWLAAAEMATLESHPQAAARFEAWRASLVVGLPRPPPIVVLPAHGHFERSLAVAHLLLDHRFVVWHPAWGLGQVDHIDPEGAIREVLTGAATVLVVAGAEPTGFGGLLNADLHALTVDRPVVAVVPTGVVPPTWLQRRPLVPFDLDAPAAHPQDAVFDPERHRKKRLQVLVAAGLPEPRRELDPTPPYLGLRSFEAAQADRFFGREADTEDLFNEIMADRDGAIRLRVVTGASGSGKSSLVRAGLLPRVRSAIVHVPHRWHIAELRPAQPFADLTRALTALLGASATELDRTPEALHQCVTAALPAGERLLLVVDQAEELFTLAPAAERNVFLNTLLHATRIPGGPTSVVLTLRADFLHRFLAHPELGPALKHRLSPITALTADGLAQAISRPALRAMGRFDTGLPALMAEAVIREPGHLPLLAFALDQLWDQAATDLPRPLTLTAYEAIGGVAGAIAHHADQVLKALHARGGEASLRRARRLLGKLIKPGQGEHDTRRPTPRADLVPLGEAELNHLIQGRLLTAESDRVELAHEALIRRWQTLRTWIDEDRDHLRAQQRLEVAASEWAASKGVDLLWRGTLLADAHERIAREQIFPGETARALIEASERAARRRQWRIRGTVTVALIGSLAAAIVGFALYGRASVAQTQAQAAADAANHAGRKEAEARATAVEAAHRAVAAERVAHDQRDLAVADSIFNTALASTDRVVRALLMAELVDRPTPHQALARFHGVPWRVMPSAVLRGLDGVVEFAALSADSSRVVARSETGTLAFWRADGRGDAVVLTGRSATFSLFSPDGTQVLTAFDDGIARLLAADGGLEGSPLVGPTHVSNAVFSPDGTRIATASADGIHIWQKNGAGAWTPTLIAPALKLPSMLFSPTGKQILTVERDDELMVAQLWHTDGQKPPTGLGKPITDLAYPAFSPDGTQFMALSRVSSEIYLWSTQEGGQPTTLRDPDDAVGVHFGPRGEIYSTTEGAVSAWDPQKKTWNVLVKSEVPSAYIEVTLDNRRTHMLHFTFGECSDSVQCDGVAMVHWLDGATPSIILRTDDEVVTAMNPFLLDYPGRKGIQNPSLSPDGQWVVTPSAKSTVLVWPIDGRGEPAVFPVPGGARALASSRDGAVILAVTDTAAWILSPDPQRAPILLPDPMGPGVVAALSPDGERVIVAVGNRALVWQTDGRGEPITLLGHTAKITSVAFSPDGARILTASHDTTARIWSVDGTGEPQVLPASFGWAIFSPDGARIVTAGDHCLHFWSQGAIGPEVAPLKEDARSGVFSPDGHLLALGDGGQSVRIWSGPKAPVRLTHGDDGISAVSFSPDSTRVVTGSDDGTAQVWRVDGQGDPVTLRHFGYVRGVAFSPDGQHIATASYDGTVRVWSADGRAEPIVLHADSWVRAVAFTPDGTRIIAGSGDGIVRIWHITWPGLLQSIRGQTTACLLPKDRTRFLFDSPEEARSRYEACERHYERTPLPPDHPTLQ